MSGVYSYEAMLGDMRRRKRRRRLILVVLVLLIIFLGYFIALTSLEEPTFTVQSMSVERISIPTNTVYIGMLLAIDNTNGVAAHLLGVEGTVLSGGEKLGEFVFDEDIEIPPNTNYTVDLDFAVSGVPLPLQDPVMQVDGKARIRTWILGLTYHFSHSIPLTYSPDQDNEAPVAAMDLPRWARRNRPAAFDGSGSFDPDGRVVGWEWEFGDGSRVEGQIVEHTFSSPGEYEIVLTVVDQMGERAQARDTLRVLPI